MMTPDIHNGKTFSFGRKIAIGFIVVAVILSGCSKASKKADDPWEGGKKEELRETQDESSRKTDTTVKKDESTHKKPVPQPAADTVVKKDAIILARPVLSPAAASAGGTVRQELKYSVFSVKTGTIKITEVIVLSGNGLQMELSKKVLEKMQGDNSSIFQFILPKDLPPGQYKLITSISFGKERKTATGSFRVIR
jgi:hypothetical protein